MSQPQAEAAQNPAPATQATRYDFATQEPLWAETWERSGSFAPRTPDLGPVTQSKDCAFAIMMPPPNVTGTLHLGHALDNTLPDILVRRARMQGKCALYQPGEDHASIAVHVVLERQWAKEGKTRFDFGREAFMEKAWEWKDHSANIITGQMRRLGISCDWGNERFTMDPAYSAAVNHVFIEMFDRGLIYRGQRLVNWDPKMQTAVSDLEVTFKEVHGHLWHVRYKFADGGSYDGKDGIEIATTRPETILADGAIAIHPDDTRAKDLVGRKVLVPMVNREIEIIADDMVDPEFGSGMVKVTAAHDFNDFAFYQRHKHKHAIPLINLLTPDAHMADTCPAKYVGMDRFEARKQIVKDLEALGQLIQVEDHIHNVGHAERDDTILEPYLTWQWYVKGKPLAEKCLKAAENGDVKFVNDRDARVYRNWLENIQDWCISRQLWWGHRIPAWFKDVPGQTEQDVYVGDEPPVGEGWKQDEDVLDTWFSSALWPFVTQGWPTNLGDRFQTFYPGHVIMSGRDILFFWLIRMMMMGLELTGKAPFPVIYTHGLILDEHGQKMSKSKGNVVDPIELINQFGSDALRLTMAGIASAEDMRFSLGKVEQSRNFCTKLWNAARFMNMQGVSYTPEDAKKLHLNAVKNPVNRWMIAALKTVLTTVDGHLDRYEFNQAAFAATQFVWNTWCDWYLEFTKPMLAGDMGADVAEETRLVMGWGFSKVLKMLHPFIPFITEEIWQKHAAAKQGAFLMNQAWPVYADFPVDDAYAQVEQVMRVAEGVRQIRTMHKLSPKVMVKLEVRGLAADAFVALQTNLPLLTRVAGVESLMARTNPAGHGEAATVVDGAEFILPLAGLIDMDAEKARMEKEKAKMEAEIAKITGLLDNPNFVARAPEDVLAQNRTRLAELQENLTKLQAMLG
jgi:valyl-tRNA synthetase